MYQRILVPVDGSPPSHAGLNAAIATARLTGGQLRLLHVVDSVPYAMSAEGYGAMSADVLGMMRGRGEEVLQEARAQVAKAGVAVDTVLVDAVGGRLGDHVCEQATDWNADLIVIGSHGRRGISRLLLGSDAEQVLRTASVPVLLVRKPEGAETAQEAGTATAASR